MTYINTEMYIHHKCTGVEDNAGRVVNAVLEATSQPSCSLILFTDGSVASSTILKVRYALIVWLGAVGSCMWSSCCMVLFGVKVPYAFEKRPDAVWCSVFPVAVCISGVSDYYIHLSSV